MKIEYGIEIPQRKPLNGKGRDSIYPFHSMGLGDSFSVQKAWRTVVDTDESSQPGSARRIPRMCGFGGSSKRASLAPPVER
jgi:hypothetical protein